jgi:hypothetical protein
MTTDLITTATTGDDTAVRRAVHQIQTELRNLARNEGSAVASHLRIGTALADLRKEAKSGWFKQLKELGINERVARRYIRLGNSWLAVSGLSESALLEQLPPDRMKLEWLCRLTAEQLRELLGRLDCKKAKRGQVEAAVRKALGEEDAAPTAPNIEKALAKIFKRFRTDTDQLEEATPPQNQERFQALVAEGLWGQLNRFDPMAEIFEVPPGADQEDNGEGPLAS